MATVDSNFFEIQRRGYQWNAISTLDDGITSMGWDTDPNTVVNGNTPGETKLYAMPAGSMFFESGGLLWLKVQMPNTWITLNGDPAVSATLLHSQAVPAAVPGLSFSMAVCQSRIIDYAIKELVTGDVRTGQLMISANAVAGTTSIQDFHVDTLDVGVAWSLDASAAPLVEVKYTTLGGTANNKTMQAVVKQILF